MSLLTDFDYAASLDRNDPIAEFRNKFVIDDPDLVYLDGNSLGRLPKSTVVSLQKVINNQWGKRLIQSWNESWINLAEKIGQKIARLTGAKPDEVILADSTSVNLFKLAFAAVMDRPGRTKIITDNLNFPSDIYILQNVAKLCGDNYELKIINSPDGISVPTGLIEKELDEKTALLSLSHVAFKSSYLYPMDEITRMAHQNGILVLWDLSHSAGAVPFSLNSVNVDLAVGCTYKYLNGGPGAPAFLYVKNELQKKLFNPISGWFGQKNPFQFELAYQPEESIKKFLTGTPPVISLSAVNDGIDLILQAGNDNLRTKSLKQSEYFIQLFDLVLQPLGFMLNSPRDSSKRGSHISIAHDEGYRIARALIEQEKIIPDFRSPDNIRIGIAPIYTTFTDILKVVLSLKKIIDRKTYEKISKHQPEVT